MYTFLVVTRYNMSEYKIQIFQESFFHEPRKFFFRKWSSFNLLSESKIFPSKYKCIVSRYTIIIWVKSSGYLLEQVRKASAYEMDVMLNTFGLSYGKLPRPFSVKSEKILQPEILIDFATPIKQMSCHIFSNLRPL